MCSHRLEKIVDSRILHGIKLCKFLALSASEQKQRVKTTITTIQYHTTYCLSSHIPFSLIILSLRNIWSFSLMTSMLAATETETCFTS